jgi:uncharacterized protein
MTIPIIVNLLAVLAICALLYGLQKKHLSLGTRVFCALALGVALGGVMHYIYSANSSVISLTNSYLEIIGMGYVKPLQMVVMPLILVSILTLFPFEVP